MPLDEQFTRAWNSTNAAGGALASALHAGRGERVDIPDALRRPSKPRTEQDAHGEALLLANEALRHLADAMKKTEAVIADLQKQLATR